MIEVRLGELNDIPFVMALNQKWLMPNIDDQDISWGFLFGDPLKASDLEKIAYARELAVAQLDDQIVGYYLFDNFSETETLQHYTLYINNLVEKGIISQGINVSKRAQAVIDKEFQNQGISKKLFEILLIQTKEKYDILFSVVSKKNPKLIAHQKAGWEIVAENDNLYFVQYNFKGK